MSKIGKTIGVLAILISCSVASVHAAKPSFDCAKASFPDEVALCGDADLAEADQQQATMFQLALAKGPRSEVLALTRGWLSERRQCGSDKTCILRVQRKTIRGLNEFAKVAPLSAEAAAKLKRETGMTDYLADDPVAPNVEPKAAESAATVAQEKSSATVQETVDAINSIYTLCDHYSGGKLQIMNTSAQFEGGILIFKYSTQDDKILKWITAIEVDDLDPNITVKFDQSGPKFDLQFRCRTSGNCIFWSGWGQRYREHSLSMCTSTNAPPYGTVYVNRLIRAIKHLVELTPARKKSAF